jgi:hypothetical protein
MNFHPFLEFYNPKTFPPLWIHLLISILHQTLVETKKCTTNDKYPKQEINW